MFSIHHLSDFYQFLYKKWTNILLNESLESIWEFNIFNIGFAKEISKTLIFLSNAIHNLLSFKAYVLRSPIAFSAWKFLFKKWYKYMHLLPISFLHCVLQIQW